MLVDLTAQLDRTERLLRQLLAAKTGRKSEQLSREQLALFAAEVGRALPEPEAAEQDQDDSGDPPLSVTGESKPRGRKPLPRHLKRERIEHDLAEADKHCAQCDQDLRRIGEEVSERYEYLPAQMKVIEDACFTYACACTVKTAGKPAQPIEKSTASASLLAQVMVAKYADHLPLHRQAKMFARHGVELSDQTLCGWTAQCATLLEPLYERLKRFVLASKIVGTDDTPVKVLDRKLPQARKGRIWPYVGDPDHMAAVYDYTATRERAGPEEFLKHYRGHLQADAYVAYDAFFTKPSVEWWRSAAGRTRAGTFIMRWKAIPRACGRYCF
jgi:transposase